MKNKILGISMLTITCLYGMLAAIVILVVLLAGGDVLYAILGSIIVLIIQFLISPWLTDLTMKWFYKAKFGADIPEYLSKFIKDQCKKHDVTYPKIAIIDDGGPNAFTYGRTKKDARIVLTRGIFDLLTEEEVIAVVAHEMGHIVHLDMLVMTAVQVVPLILYAIYEAFARSNSDNDNNKLAIVGYIAYILYLISQYIILWLSRTREYYADEFSAEESKNPNALAEALVKIGFGLVTNQSEGKHNVSANNSLGIFDVKAGKALAVTAMGDNKKISKDKIKNAMKWEMWNPWAIWFELNSTHPLISKRLKALSELSHKYKQEPYVNFDLKKSESYVDDFLLELLVSFAPTLCFIATVVATIIAIAAEENFLLIVSCGLFAIIIFSLLKYKRAHKSGYKKQEVVDLLGEVKVSHITSIPCTLKGTIIGKGDPGYVFSEDFIIKDKSGIIFLDYNQPLYIVNKIFAIFKSKEYIGKEVEVQGWYRRSPVPYVEIYKYTVNGKTKTVFTYPLAIGLYITAIVFSLFFIAASLM